jgi:hypothetical protein
MMRPPYLVTNATDEVSLAIVRPDRMGSADDGAGVRLRERRG